MNWELAGFAFSVVVQIGSSVFFFGRLTQSVRDLKDRVESLEGIINSITKRALSKAVSGD
jgi:prefoldin subunit 5